jgi:ubiquinone biosynthesis protein Coq4
VSASGLRYASQASSQTLREGLAEYYEHNPALLDPAQMDPQAAQLFRQHDAAHVVFGCDTSLRGETLIDTWTIFGSTIGLRGYLAYLKLPQVNQLFAQAGARRIASELLRCLGDVLRVIWRSQRLRQKWAWRGYDAHLDQPLAEIRERFGIRVV